MNEILLNYTDDIVSTVRVLSNVFFTLSTALIIGMAIVYVAIGDNPIPKKLTSVIRWATLVLIISVMTMVLLPSENTMYIIMNYVR